MKNTTSKTRCLHLPKLKWKWLLAWLIIHPIAATPLILMVTHSGPFKQPFIVNGPVALPALLLAVLPVLLLIHGSGILDPVSRDE